MRTAVAGPLLDRWIYVLVKVGRQFIVPYTPAALERLAARAHHDPEREPDYGPDFVGLLEGLLASMADSPQWAPGNYYPGGWVRALRARGQVPTLAAATPENLEAFRQPEILVDADGAWWVGDRRLDARIRGFLLRRMEFDAELERYRVRYRLESYDETRYLHHRSPPLRVVGLALSGEECVVLLNDDSRERLRPQTLRLDRQERLYCAVRQQRLPAWFTDAARFTLLDRLEPADGAWALHLPGGTRHSGLQLEDDWPGADRLPEPA